MIKRKGILSVLILPMLCVLVLSASPAQAEVIYKWTDEKGTVHYGERPPEGVNAQRVTVSNAPDPDEVDDPYASARAPEGEPSAAQQQREQRAQMAEEQRQEAARIAAACEAQKSRLEQLIPRAKVILQNPDGTSRMLDDDERLSMIAESQKFVDENCN